MAPCSVDQLAPVFPAVPGEQDDVDPDELLVDGVTAYLEAVRADPATWQVVLLPPEGSPQEMQLRANRLRRLLLTDPQRWTVEAFSDFTRAVLAALHPDPS